MDPKTNEAFEESMKELTEAQKTQVKLQYENQQHDDVVTDIELTPVGDCLKGFKISKGVWNPASTSARYYASYLFFNTHLYEDKIAYDIGCGSGIAGIVMAMQGARKALLSDISLPAVENTKTNIINQGLNNAEAFVSDLFDSYASREKADCIFFNHPFFLGKPPSGDTIAASMLSDYGLLDRFFSEAGKYLNEGGVIIMPYYDVAAENGNHPEAFAKKYSYDISLKLRLRPKNGVQRGEVYIYELKPKK